MEIEICEEPISTLSEYGEVSIAFKFDRVIEASLPANGLNGVVLTELKLDEPRIKDYDAIKGEEPSNWCEKFDVSKWGLIVARLNSTRIGGAVIAFDSPGLDMLEGRNDLAVLWDIRIDPSYRGRGVGARLFKAAEEWATQRGCKRLKIETQNINLAANKFYENQGCSLESINPKAYALFPDEIQMLWYKNLK